MAKDIGIDLGTANTLICMRGKGIILREPSVVAVDIRNDTVKFVGQEAKDVIGRTPSSIVTVRPLKDGVIADFDIAASMLQLFIRKTLGSVRFSRPRIVICLPSGVTAVERRAVREVAFKAGAQQVGILEEPMAAAIGAGLPVGEANGSMVIDIGGGTVEVAVLSLGSMVVSHSTRSGGDEFDRQIIDYVKQKYNVLIGSRTAEGIKMRIGSAAPYEGEEPVKINGRDLADGFPQEVVLTPEEIRDVLEAQVDQIVEAVRVTLERTPPELSADIISNGVTLTGGGALLHGLDVVLERETGIPTHIAENPLDCVVVGAGRVLEAQDAYRRAVVFDSKGSL